MICCSWNRISRLPWKQHRPVMLEATVDSVTSWLEVSIEENEAILLASKLSLINPSVNFIQKCKYCSRFPLDLAFTYLNFLNFELRSLASFLHLKFYFNHFFNLIIKLKDNKTFLIYKSEHELHWKKAFCWNPLYTRCTDELKWYCNIKLTRNIFLTFIKFK